MFQRLFQRRIYPPCLSVLQGLVLWAVLVFPIFSFSQTDFLQVTFDRVSIQDTTIFRELSAGFPHPVLSVITVKDQDNRYVHGLADTTRWLGPAEITETGDSVNAVWQMILEYHEEDPSLPANPDVKQTIPEFMVTEVSQGRVSVALAMDYSGSMGKDLYVAEDAAKAFVRKITKNDRVAIVKITASVEVFQDFTSDTTLLIEAIETPTANRLGTAVYDGIYQAITLCQNETPRKAVIAYTDGIDDMSVHTIDEVIDHALDNEVPIYTIGLGGEIKESELVMIANRTGGYYMHAMNAEALASIYISIYGYIRGYYILAHTSPDPNTNGTWRIVDLTLKTESAVGRGLGKYFVPFIPSNVRVSKGVITDSVSVVDEESLHFAFPGDTVLYDITVANAGPGVAREVKVVDFPADSFLIVDFETTPESSTEDSIRWQIPQLNVGESVHLRYRCFVDTFRIQEMVAFGNKVIADCDVDTMLQDNTDSTTVYFIPLNPGDVSVEKRGVGTSFTLTDGDSTWYVSPGDTAVYHVTLVNQGEIDCRNVTVQEILPEEVTLIEFSESGFTLEGDTLMWVLDRLDARGGREEFTYRCFVDSVSLLETTPLINRVSISCAEDTILHNNIDMDTLYYVPLLPADVSVTKRGVGDSLFVDQGDSVWYVHPGNTVEYNVSLINTGQISCRDILVQDVLPEEVALINFSESSSWQSGDTLYWTVDYLRARGGEKTFTYTCRVDTFMPPWEVPLVNHVTFDCEEDMNPENNSARDTVWVTALIPPDPQVRVSPSEVEVGDSVQVEVRTPIDLQGWDLSIFFENNIWIDTYGDAFIQSHVLEPNVWTTIVPDFTDTWMSTDKNQERVGVIFETFDLWDVTRSDTAYFTLLRTDPQVRVSPSVIEPMDSVQVEVSTPVDVQGWDLSIFFENNMWIDTYGDAFIQSHILEPKVWTTVIPDFSDTWMRTDEEQERVGVVFQTWNLWNVTRSDTAYFTLQSADEFLLDENVFKPGGGVPLGMRFMLSSNRRAVIKLYDISGGFLKTIVDGPYNAGWNVVYWDGRDENSLIVGSGIYVAILTSGNFQKARKFILIR